ncbi:MAG: glycosyltransferase [Solirubrobacteraceae bacterium]
MTRHTERAPGPPRLLIAATVDNFLRDFLLPFARHYRALGWRVDALAARDETYGECAAVFDEVWDIDWTREPAGLLGLPKQLRTVREIVARGRYDIVHVHTPIAALVTRLALRRRDPLTGPKLIYTAHGFHFSADRTTRGTGAFLVAEKLAGRWTDELVVINRADHLAAARWRLVPADRLHLMPGIGLDIGRYRADRVTAAEIAQVRNGLGLGPGDSLFLMIAEFTANKRHADAILALEQLGRSDVHLAVAGREGATLPAIRRLTTERGVERQVHILGFRDDIPALVKASVATMLVSGREGLPRSVMESLSLATPVIGTDIRGVHDLLADGGGLLVKVGDVKAIAQAMAWMLNHPDDARASGDRGSNTLASYDLRHVIALHDGLYENTLPKVRSGP